ncbi:unnamed protein product (macronuclear) [Paramecium tetraurelia]|uniref:Uncharacterized protein n=1 Tax=Paramecium tetraurelia TaxID=5888 RepID=A0BVR2_PARTE|nr:uncharacterized protein GSPATT00032481001 [Paramecium tetraurelia]CAK62629.1 unnamed protein product [Paramecium tetraurelia]|eukprot:XP_001430027.1 hypothetical protein (macronuclear) [Paramecium tetraurelia strain d4-2]
MKSFKVSSGIMDIIKNQSKDVKSSQMIVDKVNEIHSGIDENNLKLVNQHLINHFQLKPIVSAIEQPNNPLQKIRNRSKPKFQSLLHSQISQEVESVQNSYQYTELLSEKDKEINYYKNHIQQLTEELQKLTELFETVRNENQSLKNQVDQTQNYQLIISNQQKQILKLQQDNVELEMILKNTLLQQERQKFQSQSSKQSIIIKKNSLNGQKLKLSNNLSLSEQMNNSNMSTSFISCPDNYNQKQKSHRANERVKTNQTVPTLPDSKIYSNDQYYVQRQGKENIKMRY